MSGDAPRLRVRPRGRLRRRPVGECDTARGRLDGALELAPGDPGRVESDARRARLALARDLRDLCDDAARGPRYTGAALRALRRGARPAAPRRRRLDVTKLLRRARHAPSRHQKNGYTLPWRPQKEKVRDDARGRLRHFATSGLSARRLPLGRRRHPPERDLHRARGARPGGARQVRRQG